MPAVVDMTVNGEKLPGVIGKACRRSGPVGVSDRLDGSSLDIGRKEHKVVFTLDSDLLPAFKRMLELNRFVTFSASYSTGEKVDRAEALVAEVNPQDNGGVEYTLSIGPGEATIDAPAPG